MNRLVMLLGILIVAGCATRNENAYRPYKSREKKAFSRVDRSVTITDVSTNFAANVTNEVAWVGVIEDIQFKEMERTIQVAFEIDHREFDWIDHGGRQPYHLSSTGQGRFRAGWTVDKPARISNLKTRAKPGYMIVVYGTPYRMQNGVIQLAATSVRPIKASKFIEILPTDGSEPAEDEG